MQFTEEQKKELLTEIDYNRKNCFLSSKTELLMKVAEAALKAKPVAWRWEKNNGLYFEGIKPIGVDSQPLYTAPPATAPAVPDGWKLVPVEPIWEMLSADGCKEHHNGQPCLHHDNRRRIWSAMLAAAPSPSDTL